MTRYAPQIGMMVGGLLVAVAAMMSGGSPDAPPPDPNVGKIVTVEFDVWRDLADFVATSPQFFRDTDKLLAVIETLHARGVLSDISRADVWRPQNSPITPESLPTIIYTLKGAPPAP